MAQALHMAQFVLSDCQLLKVPLIVVVPDLKTCDPTTLGLQAALQQDLTAYSHNAAGAPIHAAATSIVVALLAASAQDTCILYCKSNSF